MRSRFRVAETSENAALIGSGVQLIQAGTTGRNGWNLKSTNATVTVAGTGPAGMIAALALSRAGFSVHLAGPAPNLRDGRTTALMSPALAFLADIGVLSEIEPESAPLRVMRIVDGTRRLVRSPVVTFHAGEIGEAYFGLNVPNRALNKALETAVRDRPEIRWHEAMVERWGIAEDRVTAHLNDGSELSAALAVAADGRHSLAREAAGIRTSTQPYGQSALALSFRHTRGHSSISTEFHTESGPFTQVPLPGNRSSLVWVVEQKEAERLSALPQKALSAEVEAKMQSMLGQVTVDSHVQVYPYPSACPARSVKTGWPSSVRPRTCSRRSAHRASISA